MIGFKRSNGSVQMVQPKDPSLIPSGEYCYQWVKLAPGEVVPPAGPEIGRSQRECARPGDTHKEVLCPYFEYSGYRTVRCLFLGQEVLRMGDDPTDVVPDVVARFGTPAAAHWFAVDNLLGDSIKVCGVGQAPDPMEGEEEEDLPTLNEVDRAGRPVYRHLIHLLPGDCVEHPQLGPGYVTDVRVPDDGPALVFVNFGASGDHALVRDETLLRRVTDRNRQGRRVPSPPSEALPWSAVTGLVGPGEPGRSGPWTQANKCHPRGDMQVIQAGWPPFTVLGQVLADLLEPMARAAPWREALGGVLWTNAVPAREPLLPDLWPQGEPCRWLEITEGRLFDVHQAPAKRAVHDLFQTFRQRVQSLRCEAVTNGQWWPAPQRLQLLLAGGGRHVGLRLRFEDGYQPHHQPWVVRWLALEPPPTRVWPGPFSHLLDVKVGEWVEHSAFGLGQVLTSKHDGHRWRARVDFGWAGPKWLALDVAYLRRVGAPSPSEQAVWRNPLVLRHAGLSLEQARERALSPLRGSRARPVQASEVLFKALRGLMADVLAPLAWRDFPVWDSVWRAAVPVWPHDEGGEIASGAWPGEAGAEGRALDLLNLPPALDRAETLAFIGKLSMRFFSRLEALQGRAVDNGRWWPMPQAVLVLVSSEGLLGMRLHFPPAFEPKGQIGFEFWHPTARTLRARPALSRLAPSGEPQAPQAEPPLAFETARAPTPWLGSPVRAQALPEPLPPLPGSVWLLQTHVAGLAYHQAAKAVADLQAGTPLTLRREPGNPHDALAIEVLIADGVKLGYVPRNRNPVLARLMDGGERLSAQVVAVQALEQPATADVPASRRVLDLRFRVDWVRGDDPQGGPPCST